MKLHSKSKATIFLFSSPESLIKELWLSLLSHLITQDVLKQVCIDEVHLFVMFSITFRHSFLKLCSLLFNKLKLNQEQQHLPNSIESKVETCLFKVPIVVMTATFNSQLLYYLQ